MRLARRILYFVLIVAALAAVVYHSRGALHRGFRLGRLIDAVEEARLSLLLIGLAGIYAAYGLRALRWKRFCRWLGNCTFANVYSATIMGFAGIFLLGRPGEPVRPLLLARKCRFPVSSMFGIWLLERLFDVAATAALLGISLLLPSRLLLPDADNDIWEIRLRASGGVLLLAIVGLVALFIYFRVHGAGAMERRLANWREASARWKRHFAANFSGFSEGLQAIRTFPDFLAAVFYSAAHWTLVAFAYWLILHSFGGTLAVLDFRGAMLVLVFTMVGSTVQLPTVGGGTQVLSFIALTQIFGVEDETAAAAAIVLWLITFAGACIAGVPLLVHEGWSMGELRRLARAESEAERSGSHIAGTKSEPGASRGVGPEGDSAR
jgi:glycosyltransferase 2 family protein